MKRSSFFASESRNTVSPTLRKFKRTSRKKRFQFFSCLVHLKPRLQIMQEWYESMASHDWDQIETLSDRLDDLQVELPQISPGVQDLLDEELTCEEVENAINEAHEVSAPGPTGQTITFYKLLFQEIPDILTAAVNQLVFNSELASNSIFQWIKEQKVIYISKRNHSQLLPATTDPLSMLEVLYKIPSRILAKRLSMALP
jgi:hypothetical protein